MCECVCTVQRLSLECVAGRRGLLSTPTATPPPANAIVLRADGVGRDLLLRSLGRDCRQVRFLLMLPRLLLLPRPFPFFVCPYSCSARCSSHPNGPFLVYPPLPASSVAAFCPPPAFSSLVRQVRFLSAPIITLLVASPPPRSSSSPPVSASSACSAGSSSPPALSSLVRPRSSPGRPLAPLGSGRLPAQYQRDDL